MVAAQSVIRAAAGNMIAIHNVAASATVDCLEERVQL